MVINAAVAINVEKNKSSSEKEKIEANYGYETFSYNFGEIDRSWDLDYDDNDNIYDGDTGGCIDWAPDNHNGIYSVRGADHRGFNDAWGVCAAECGPIVGTEEYEGHAILKSPNFRISDLDYDIDVNRKDFEFTSADLYFDYNFGSEDFSNEANDDWVKISSIQIIYGGNSRDIHKEILEWRPKDIGYPAGDDWREDTVNDYKASSTTFKSILNNQLDESFRILIRLDCKLIAGVGNEEMFEFFLKDVKIKGEYYFDSNPSLHVPSSRYKGDIRSAGTYSIDIPVKNIGGGGLDWRVDTANIEFVSDDLRNPGLTVSPTEGYNLRYGSEDVVRVSYTQKNHMQRSCYYKWDVPFTGNGGQKTVRVKFGVGTWSKQKSIEYRFLNYLENFESNLFRDFFELLI